MLATALLCAVIIGDSISAWEDSYAQRTYAGWTLENPSRNGWSAADWVARGGPLLDQVQCDPDVVSILLGANDVFQRRSPAAFRRDMITLIEDAETRWPGAEIWISIPTRLYNTSQNFPDVHRKLSQLDREIVLLIEDGYGELGVDHRALRLFVNFFPDTVHPGPGGRDVMADAWAERFSEELAPETVNAPGGWMAALVALLAVVGIRGVKRRCTTCY